MLWMRTQDALLGGYMKGKTMTDRERLLEILNVPIYPHESKNPAEVVADYLLDKGVTFQKWIPVTERLPEKEGSYIVLTTSGAVTTGRFYTEMIFEPTHYRDKAYVRKASWSRNRNVTHWMPLPETPREETP